MARPKTITPTAPIISMNEPTGDVPVMDNVQPQIPVEAGTPIYDQPISNSVNAALGDWNKFAEASNQKQKIEQMKKVLDAKGEGYKQFIAEISTKMTPDEITTYIPTPDVSTDQYGQVDWMDAYKRAYVGLEAWRKDKLENKKADFTVMKEQGVNSRASQTIEIRKKELEQRASAAASTAQNNAWRNSLTDERNDDLAIADILDQTSKQINDYEELIKQYKKEESDSKKPNNLGEVPDKTNQIDNKTKIDDINKAIERIQPIRDQAQKRLMASHKIPTITPPAAPATGGLKRYNPATKRWE